MGWQMCCVFIGFERNHLRNLLLATELDNAATHINAASFLYHHLIEDVFSEKLNLVSYHLS